MTFNLHHNLANKTQIGEFPLCRLLLEDEKHYPWLILIPRRLNVSRIMDLSFSDQIQLLKELDIVQKFMWEEFKPTQLNVAAIGNKTPQLHIHVIARYTNDPAWPNTVWDHPVKENYDENSKKSITERLLRLLKTTDFSDSEGNFCLKEMCNISGNS